MGVPVGVTDAEGETTGASHGCWRACEAVSRAKGSMRRMELMKSRAANRRRVGEHG